MFNVYKPFLFLILTLHTFLLQDTPTKIDRIITIEDFEGFRKDHQKWKLKFKKVSGVRGFLTTSSLQITSNSSGISYLNINFFGTRENGVRIYPPRPRFIPGYVRRLEIKVFGFGHSDQLYLDIRDKKGDPHRLYLGSLKFQGWKKLRIVFGKSIYQRGRTMIKGKPGITFRGLYFKPHHPEKPGLCMLYIDDIRAVVRDYYRKPDPNWKY